MKATKVIGGVMHQFTDVLIAMNTNILIKQIPTTMYLQIKTIELQPDKYGKHIKITKIGLYDASGKWQRWVKLNEELIELLKVIQISTVI